MLQLQQLFFVGIIAVYLFVKKLSVFYLLNNKSVSTSVKFSLHSLFSTFIEFWGWLYKKMAGLSYSIGVSVSITLCLNFSMQLYVQHQPPKIFVWTCAHLFEIIIRNPYPRLVIVALLALCE
jgi:hypothetical protein